MKVKEDSTEIDHLRELVVSLKTDIEVALKALKFYEDSYRYGLGNGMSWESCEELKNDSGNKAREAIAKMTGSFRSWMQKI